MNQELNDSLVKVIVDMIVFFEFSKEEVIDPDSAIQAIENIAAELQIMDDKDKKELVKKINNIADQYLIEHRDFIKALPHTLGIA